MEATFWEANKGRIGAAIAVVALGVLGWQGWSRHQDAQRAGEWTALFDENLALRSDLDPKSFAASSPAAPWALLHTARTAFEEKDLARAQSALSDINSLREKVNVPSDLVDRIASDIANETKFSSENQATKSGISDESARLKFKLADADVEVSIFSDAALGEFAAFARSLSAASLTEIRLDQATSGTELSGSMNWTQLGLDTASMGPSKGPVPTFARTKLFESNRAGTIALRIENLGTDSNAKAFSPRLVINLKDQPERDIDSIVVGRLVSGAEHLERASMGSTSFDGKLADAAVLTRTGSN
jgi:hypothetical protein